MHTNAHTLRAIGATVAVIVIQCLMVTAYAWSAASTGPRHVPIAVTGPASSVGILTGRLSQARPGAFRFVRVPDVAAAERDVTSRAAYGAVVVPAAGGAPRVLIATAASPQVAQVLTGVADQLHGVPRPVQDLAPLSGNDPSGSASGSSVLPVMLTSLVAGILLTMLVRPVRLRLAALIAFGVGGGLVSALVTHTWLGIMPSRYAVVAAVLGLFALAVSSAVAGLGALAGRLGGPARARFGLALGGVLFMLIGNPFSGATSAPEMIPGAWGAIGQWLPPGATITLLRAVDYFGGHRSAGPWLVLAIWAVIGLGLTGISALGAASRQTRPEPRPQAATLVARESA